MVTIQKEAVMSKYYDDYEITDAHVHPGSVIDFQDFEKAACFFMDNVHIKGANLLCINGVHPDLAGSELMALALKTRDFRFSVYGGFGYWMNTIPHDGPGLKRQLEALMAAGFDGLKMFEGKPTERAAGGIALDDPRYDPSFDLLEKTGYHILSHVNDPEEFWNEDTCPKWANDGTGGYWDTNKFLSKEQYYTENENILARHPNLNITFAHAYFLSNFPDRMAALLDRYPNVTIDLCPGSEMYDGFTKQYKLWREIFVNYADRFIFGTDNVINPLSEDSLAQYGKGSIKIENIVRFLSTPDEFEGWVYKLKGLNLPSQVVKKILSDNYLRVRGKAKPVIADAVVTYAETLNAEVDNRNDIGNANKKSIAGSLQYFKTLAGKTR